jgi:cell wall-associated NlpC family hydrolase
MAEGSAVKQPAGENKGSLPGAAAGLALILLAPIVMIGVIPLMLYRGATPNPGGDTFDQAIDPRPNSATASLLEEFKAVSSSTEFLSKESSTLDSYAALLTSLKEALASNSASVAGFTDKAAAVKQVDEMLAAIEKIRSSIIAGKPEKGKKEADLLVEGIAKLQGLASGNTLITAALAIVEENAASGYTKFPYSKSDRAAIFNESSSNRGTDCSGFITYLLYKSGARSLKDNPLTTPGIYSAAQRRAFGLRIVLASTTSSGLSEDTVRKAIQPGDIILSGPLNFSEGGGTDTTRHAVLYLGNNGGNDVYVDEQTSKGPQLKPFANRFKAAYPVRVIIRKTS